MRVSVLKIKPGSGCRNYCTMRVRVTLTGRQSGPPIGGAVFLNPRGGVVFLNYFRFRLEHGGGPLLSLSV